MSAKAKSKLTPEQQKATMTRVLQKIKPYGFFVVCSLIVAAVSVAAQLYIPILCGSYITTFQNNTAGFLDLIHASCKHITILSCGKVLIAVCILLCDEI